MMFLAASAAAGSSDDVRVRASCGGDNADSGALVALALAGAGGEGDDDSAVTIAPSVDCVSFKDSRSMLLGVVGALLTSALPASAAVELPDGLDSS